MSDYSNSFGNLNEKQMDAVTSSRCNMLIFAGAGSGKTRVLVCRVSYLMQVENIPPSSILAVTFTNKAANEMRSRIYQIARGVSLSSMWIGTFHGICNRFLRIFYREAGLPENFTIIDDTDQLNIIKRIIKEHVPEQSILKPKDIQNYINTSKEKGLRARDRVNVGRFSSVTGKIVQQVYEIYEEMCKNTGIVDFNELLLRTYELFKSNSSVREQIHNNFQEILVDEFQDTNDLQMKLLQEIKGDSCMLTVVGDDDQSIYSWRGANPQNILNFGKNFENVKVIKLEQNYRSTGNILAVANNIISENKNRESKKLWTSSDMGDPVKVFTAVDGSNEADFVVNSIRKFHDQNKIPYSDFAILYRNNFLSLAFENVLRAYDIPYDIIGGHKFYDRQEIKDALAYIRIMVNHDDDPAFIRVVNVPARKIGEKSIDKLTAIAREENVSLWNAAKLACERRLISGAAGNGLAGFMSTVENITEQIDSGDTLSEIVKKVIDLSGLRDYYTQVEKKERDLGKGRTANLDELVNSTMSYQFVDEGVHFGLDALSLYLQNVSLDSTDNTEEGEFATDKVKLLTIHSSKGLEFDTVYLVGFEEGILPSGMSMSDGMRQIEEERRLAYVAITRARVRCFISYAQSRLVYGKYQSCMRSRFYDSINKDYLEVLKTDEFFRIHSGKYSGKKQWPKMVTLDYKKNASEFLPGDSVVHPKFGEGVITKVVDEHTSSTKLWINFENSGMKCLYQQFSQLKKL